MCYGMGCPHEDAWGECRTGGRGCPLPTVGRNFDVDLSVCEDYPALQRLYLEDPKWGEEVFCFYDRESYSFDEGMDAEIEEDVCDRAVVMGHWMDETHEAFVRWPGRPEWAWTEGEE